MKKLTKSNIKNLEQIFYYYKGVVKVSDWTTGSGRHTKRRNIPPYCKEYSWMDYKAAPEHVKNYLDENPRVIKVVAVENLDVVQEILENRGAF